MVDNTVPNIFVDGTQSDTDKVNENFYYVVPIGGIIHWAKTLSGVPQTLSDGWVECDGSVVSDGDSPLDGVTIPDLNGDNRFLRSNSTSGGTGGADTIDIEHNHTGTTGASSLPTGGTNTHGSGVAQHTHTFTSGDSLSDAQSILPTYYEVVMIMRIK